MAIALLSVGLMGLLLFVLGLNVSRERRSVIITQHEAEADPKSALRKAIRAHGNCVEYVPMLSLMILALGLRLPIVPFWVAALMIAAVAFRYIHAFGTITGETVYSPTPFKFIGAVGTYLVGGLLAVTLIVRAAGLL